MLERLRVLAAFCLGSREKGFAVVDEKILDEKLLWCPTDNQFEAYQKREIEMAKENIKFDGGSTTLHLYETLRKAGAKNVVDLARSPRR